MNSLTNLDFTVVGSHQINSLILRFDVTSGTRKEVALSKQKDKPLFFITKNLCLFPHARGSYSTKSQGGKKW